MKPAEIIRETDKYIIYRSTFQSKGSKELKFRCVGGPLDGKMMTRTQMREGDHYGQFHPRSRGGGKSGYFAYNASGYSPFSMLWVYLEKQS